MNVFLLHLVTSLIRFFANAKSSLGVLGQQGSQCNQCSYLSGPQAVEFHFARATPMMLKTLPCAILWARPNG
jgi:hypothetical protein